MLLALVISFFAAVLPTLFWVLLFYWADRYEREPLWLAAGAFLWGAVPAVVVSLVGEVMLGTPFLNAPGTLEATLVEGAVVAPIVEELVKALALLAIFWFRPQEFDGPLDGLIYGALVGFGFAMTENFFYFVGAGEEGLGSLSMLIFLRAALFGLNHSFYTALTGLGLGLARTQPRRGRALLLFALGLGAAIATHALHNAGASMAEVSGWALLANLVVAGGGVALFLVAVALAWRNERAIMRDELKDEIGVSVTDAEYAALQGRWRRPLLRAGAAARSRDRRLQQAAELALYKQRLRRRGADRERGVEERIAGLRAQLGAQLAPPPLRTPGGAESTTGSV